MAGCCQGSERLGNWLKITQSEMVRQEVEVRVYAAQSSTFLGFPACQQQAVTVRVWKIS